MSAAALANWPHAREEAQVVTAKEREAAALATLTGVWHLRKRNPEGVEPILCGTADTRELVEAGCLTKDYSIGLLPHNKLMSGETTDDPIPYLCYPRDPKYAEQNKRERQLFAEVEQVKAGRAVAHMKLMADALRRLEVLNTRLETLASG